jgi:hypothetical protein
LAWFLWVKYFSPIDKDNHIDDDGGAGDGSVVVVVVVFVFVVTGQLNAWTNSNAARVEELTLEY